MVMPLAFAVYTAYYLLQYTRLEFSMAMPLIVASGVAAGAIHFWTLRRSRRLRIYLHAGFSVVLIGLAVVLQVAFRHDHEAYITCPICGFQALDAAETLCPVCNVVVSEKAARDEGYANLDEYIRAEQIMYFLPDPPATTIDFYAPWDGPEGYQKDPKWQPRVTEQDIREVQELVQKSGSEAP